MGERGLFEDFQHLLQNPFEPRLDDVETLENVETPKMIKSPSLDGNRGGNRVWTAYLPPYLPSTHSPSHAGHNHEFYPYKKSQPPGYVYGVGVVTDPPATIHPFQRCNVGANGTPLTPPTTTTRAPTDTRETYSPKHADHGHSSYPYKPVKSAKKRRKRREMENEDDFGVGEMGERGIFEDLKAKLQDVFDAQLPDQPSKSPRIQGNRIYTAWLPGNYSAFTNDTNINGKRWKFAQHVYTLKIGYNLRTLKRAVSTRNLFPKAHRSRPCLMAIQKRCGSAVRVSIQRRNCVAPNL